MLTKCKILSIRNRIIMKKPPFPKKLENYVLTETRIDNYYWLRDDKRKNKVINYLKKKINIQIHGLKDKITEANVPFFKHSNHRNILLKNDD